MAHRGKKLVYKDSRYANAINTILTSRTVCYHINFRVLILNKNAHRVTIQYLRNILIKMTATKTYTLRQLYEEWIIVCFTTLFVDSKLR